MINIGIVGLPNVGKSSLFNLITKSNVLSENYPFATIEPNVGIANVYDERLEKLFELYKSKKIINSTIKFYDIAGLVAGASEGQGLGNKFLSHIQEVDAICHVVRSFDNKNITHVNNVIDPISDYKVINIELILHDYNKFKKNYQSIKKKNRVINDKKISFELEVIDKCLIHLENEKLLSTLPLNDNEKKAIKKYNPLTLKPTIILINISDENIKHHEEKNKTAFTKYLDDNNISYIWVPIEFESELIDLSQEQKNEIMDEYSLQESFYNKFTKNCFNLLSLKVFFTCGPLEVHSWTTHKNSNAWDCSGVIHTDFQKTFITCEVYKCDDIIKYKTEAKAKELGLLKNYGRKSIVLDGDICTFIHGK